MATRRSRSKRWVKKQASDPYVKSRDRHGYRSRAAFKLREILERDRLLSAGGSVLDLGASPGGWSQIAAHVVGSQGLIVAVDILPMDEVANVRFIQGDCRDSDTLHKIQTELGERQIDLVISDMAPNITGIRDADEANFLDLAETVIDVVRMLGAPGSSLVMKLFQYPGTDSFVTTLKDYYQSVTRRKPDSSRAASREFYVVAKGFGI